MLLQEHHNPVLHPSPDGEDEEDADGDDDGSDAAIDVPHQMSLLKVTFSSPPIQVHTLYPLS